MEINEFIKLISRKKHTIITIVLLFVVFTIVLTAIQPFLYQSTSKIIIVQSFENDIDPYNRALANERFSSMFSKVIMSELFFRQVLKNSQEIDLFYFGFSDSDKLNKWQKTVSARPINDTGIIEIAAVHKDKEQSLIILKSIGEVLAGSHQNFHDRRDRVSIEYLNQPIVSDWPARPNAFLNIFLGAAAGLIISLCYIYLLPSEKYDIRIIPKKKRNPAANFEYTKPAPLEEKEADFEMDKEEKSRDNIAPQEAYKAKKVFFRKNKENNQADNSVYSKPVKNNETIDDLEIKNRQFNSIIRQGNMKNII